LPQFLTRQSNLQQQPQVAQLPFSQFGGQRGPLQGDTTGGIAFPDAGQDQPGTQPAQSPLSPFMLPTGLSDDELDALLGTRPSGRIGGIDFRSFKSANGRSIFDTAAGIMPGQQQPQQQQVSSLPAGGIPFEGSSGFDKFNPVLAGGTSANNINQLQSPNLSASNLPFTPNPSLLEKNTRGGFFGGF